MPITKKPTAKRLKREREARESIIQYAIPPEGTKYKMRTYYPGKRSPREQFFKDFDDLLREKARRQRRDGETHTRIYRI